MGERTRSGSTESTGASQRAVPARPAVSAAGGPAADAIALQRAVGNRAAARVLSRWAAHPDKDKKGVLMPDAMVAQYNKFNPPLGK